MNRFEFQLDVAPEQYLDYYRGVARHVIVRCTSGRTVQFPASLLQRILTPGGIHGRFALTCDEQRKCTGLQRLDEPQ